MIFPHCSLAVNILESHPYPLLATTDPENNVIAKLQELEFRKWDQQEFILFNSLSFTGSFFLIFQFVFFLFLNAIVGRLNVHFIPI